MMNKLPYAAINLFKTETHLDVSFRTSAKRLVDQMMRRTRARCAVRFLQSCLKAQVIPLFILCYFANIPEFADNPHLSLIHI